MKGKIVTASLVGAALVTQAHALLTFTLLGGNVSLSGESVATHRSTEIGGSVWDYFRAGGIEVRLGDWEYDLSGLVIEGSISGRHVITDIAHYDASGSLFGTDMFGVVLHGEKQLVPGETIRGWGACHIDIGAMWGAVKRRGSGIATASKGAPFALVVGDPPPAPVSDTGSTLLLLGLGLAAVALTARKG